MLYVYVRVCVHTYTHRQYLFVEFLLEISANKLLFSLYVLLRNSSTVVSPWGSAILPGTDFTFYISTYDREIKSNRGKLSTTQEFPCHPFSCIKK